jgi:polysaccharide chain length determinant protein (PEP-CTERM system associated)
MGKIREQSVRSEGAESFVVGEFSLRYLLEVLFRRKAILMIPILLLPILALAVTFLMSASYMSRTTILLGKGEILNPLVRFETAVSMTDWNRLSSFRKIIYSRPVLEQVIQELNLDRDVVTDRELEWLVDDIRKSVHVISVTADSFQIGCTAKTPELARDMVETISRIFIEKSLAGSRREASVAVSFIQKQVDHYRRELDEQQERMRKFKMGNLETLRRLGSLNHDLEVYRERIIETELELQKEKLTQQLLEQRLSGEKPMVVAQALFTVQTPYKLRYQKLKMKIGNLLATRGPSHPEVQKVQRELDFIMQLLDKEKQEKEAVNTREIRSPVYQEILARLENTRIRLKVLQNKLGEYGKLREDVEQKLSGIPDLERRQAQLSRKVDSTRELYDNLKLKLEYAKISREVEIEQQSNRFTIIDPPRIPLRRNKPNRKKFVLAGMAGGVSLGFLLVFLLEFTDPRVVRQGELVRLLDRELLGTIPKIHAAPGTERLLLLNLIKNLFFSVPSLFFAKRFVLPAAMKPEFLLNGQWLAKRREETDEQLYDLPEFVEKIRQISIVTRSCLTEPEGFVCGVTSTVAGEGKSLLAGNLGAVVAHDFEKPVLLIDGNHHHPILSECYARPEASGLAQVIAGEAELAETLVATDMPLLQVLPAGACPEDPTCLFRSEAFPKLLERLRKQFALVIVELPCLKDYTESQVMAEALDGLVVMTNMYSTKLRSVRYAVQRLEREKIIGFVANGTEYWIPEWLYRWV